MINQRLQRAEMFAHFAEKPVLYVHNMFGDGIDFWFISFDFAPANPSNHIHQNTLRNGICINDLILTAQQSFDKVLFLTKLSEIPKSSISFSQLHKWLLIS